MGCWQYNLFFVRYRPKNSRSGEYFNSFVHRKCIFSKFELPAVIFNGSKSKKFKLVKSVAKYVRKRKPGGWSYIFGKRRPGPWSSTGWCCPSEPEVDGPPRGTPGVGTKLGKHSSCELKSERINRRLHFLKEWMIFGSLAIIYKFT